MPFRVEIRAKNKITGIKCFKTEKDAHNALKQFFPEISIDALEDGREMFRGAENQIQIKIYKVEKCQ